MPSLMCAVTASRGRSYGSASIAAFSPYGRRLKRIAVERLQIAECVVLDTRIPRTDTRN